LFLFSDSRNLMEVGCPSEVCVGSLIFISIMPFAIYFIAANLYLMSLTQVPSYLFELTIRQLPSFTFYGFNIIGVIAASLV
jgi:hypothetical protein